jgi:hypothetical protein
MSRIEPIFFYAIYNNRFSPKSIIENGSLPPRMMRKIKQAGF